MEKVYIKDSSLEFNYCLFQPKNINYQEKYPLIVFLHGAGERGKKDGSTLENVLINGLPKLFIENDNINCFMVAPQCLEDEVWDLNIKELYSFVQSLVRSYPIDKNRITLTGISMGGFGTWSFACAYPNLFAGIAPVCGGGMSWRVDRIKHLPIKVFHGDKDNVVPISYSYNMVDALINLGNNVEFTIYHNVGHNSWDYAYTSDLLNWLLKRDKTK